jgi:exo-beta-1,3-glucanase (GH17 family)
MNKEWEFSNDVITKITIGNEIIWEHQQLEEKDLTELLQETQTVGITIRNTEFRFKITVKTDLN